MRSIFLYVSCLLITNIKSFAQCVNGDFEMGNYTNYTLWEEAHSSPGIDLNTFVQVTPPGILHGLVTSANTDPWFSALNVVHQGTYSARVGINNFGGTTAMLGYSFVVTNQNKFFSFRGAYVLNYSTEHPDQEDQAFVQYFMCRGTTPSLAPGTVLTVANSQRTFTADNTLGWDGMYIEGGTGGSSYLMYKNWIKYCVDLSSYVGETVSIFFIGSGCTANNHPGYWYIDEICGNPPPVSSFTVNPPLCYYSQVVGDGSNSVNEDDHRWTIEQVSGPNNTVVNGTGVTNTFTNTPAGVINLTQMYNAGGRSFSPGLRYKITLGVRINCYIAKSNPFPWVSTFTYVDIPPVFTVDAGPDLFFCCASAPASGQLGSAANNPSYQYQWSIKNGPVVSNAPRPIVNPLKSTTYVVTMTAPDGCSATDEMKFVYKTPVTVNFSEFCPGNACYKQLSAGISFPVNPDPTVPPCQGDNLDYALEKASVLTYLWNTGETTPTITTIPGTTFPFTPGTKWYSVTVSDGCQSQTAGYGINTYAGGWPTMNIPNIFSPNGDGIHDIYYIRQSSLADFAPNAYNAYRGEFKIFNRYGGSGAVHQVIIETCGANGILNNSWSWDGRINGQDAPIGSYYWTLKLFNCTYPNGQGFSGYVDIIR